MLHKAGGVLNTEREKAAGNKAPSSTSILFIFSCWANSPRKEAKKRGVWGGNGPKPCSTCKAMEESMERRRRKRASTKPKSGLGASKLGRQALWRSTRQASKALQGWVSSMGWL